MNSDGTLRIVLDSVATTAQYQTSNTATSIDAAIKLINWQDSPVYTALHNWYDTNITTEYSSYVVPSKFIFDTSYTDKTDSTGGGGACYYFGTYQRVGKDIGSYTPTFSETDKNIITDKVGLLTGDDIVYAGGYWESANTSYFLYNSSITTDCWTMSPSFWDNNSHKKVGMMVLDPNGKLHDWPDSGNTLTATLGLRPVITIRGDLEMTGTGTSTDPYTYK